MNDADSLRDKKQRLYAAMTANQPQIKTEPAPESDTSQATDDDRRMALVEQLLSRMKTHEAGPVQDSSGLWSEAEIYPNQPPAAAEKPEAEPSGSEQATAEQQSHDQAYEQQQTEQTEQTSPLESLLRALFPQMDQAAGNEFQKLLSQLLPGVTPGELAQWVDPKTLETFWRSLPGMGQLTQILKEGPGQAQARDKQARHSPLIVINEGGKSRHPFFCVHAILGSTFHYHRLAKLMDRDLPFYALQAQGLDPREEPLDRIEDFAHRYMAEIKRVQPHGPYSIGGYSFGSWVAYEIAQQLVRAGDEVRHLVLIGAGLPISMHAPALCANGGFAQKYMSDFRKMLLEPFLTYEERLNGGFDGWMDRFLTPLQRVYRAHFQAIMAYLPLTFPGRFLLMETIEQRASDALIALGGWDRLAGEGVESVLVSGNHLSMLEEPHIQEVAQHLNDYLKSKPGSR